MNFLESNRYLNDNPYSNNFILTQYIFEIENKGCTLVLVLLDKWRHDDAKSSAVKVGVVIFLE